MAVGPSLAVVGSGPAGFYTVLQALKRLPKLNVDIFEKQAVPFGLTRFGVAPDHPEVKNCQERFTEVADAAPNLRFWGNCEVGRDIPLKKLVDNYDAVLLAYGASADRALCIPGEQTTPGVFSARQFVGWYNGEPELQSLDVAPFLRTAETATIIGNGNVALDVARILLRAPRELKHTDITDQALDVLSRSRVRHVEIVGRRGILHSAFTTKELRELQNEPGCSMLPVEPESQRFAQGKSRAEKRKLDLMRKGSSTPLSEATRTWRMSFMQRPLEFLGGKAGLTGVKWGINEVSPDDAAKVVPTGETVETQTGVAFKSVGYRSVPIEGLEELGIKFHAQNGHLETKRGKVDGSDNVFAAGWVKTGPVGVIASTMMDSFAVGEEIASFLENKTSSRPGREALELNTCPRLVSWDDWKRIDIEEVRRGLDRDKPREKFLSTEEALKWLDSSKGL